MVKSIVIAGVGGQGTLLASKILATAAGARGLFVRTSETIGMAQRGGSVSSHLRIDAREASPIIPGAHGDILLGFELAQAVRMIPKPKTEAKCVVNTDRIIPTNVALGRGRLPRRRVPRPAQKQIPRGRLYRRSASRARGGRYPHAEYRDPRRGRGASMLPFSEEEIRAAVKVCVKPKLLAMNERAFELGLKASGVRW